MIDADLERLKRTPNIAGYVRTRLAVGFGGIALGCTFFAGVYEQRFHNFLTNAWQAVSAARSVTHETRLVLDTLEHLQRQIPQPNISAARFDSLERVVHALQEQPAPAVSCGQAHVEQRGSYSANVNNCTLKVTIPRGGSISGASLAYFGDMFRWKQDWDRQENNYIADAAHVQPQDTYTFHLR